MGTRITHYHEYTSLAGLPLELILPFKPSEGMGNFGKDWLVKEKDGKIILGYLLNDSDCENPLENSDGMGHIYTAHRHSMNKDKFLEALGLDSNGSINYDLVDEDDVLTAGKKILEDSAKCVAGTEPTPYLRALEHCEDNYVQKDDESKIEFVLGCMDSVDELETAGLDVDAIRKELWHAGRINGTIGNKHAVSLDVYEHSGVSYNISGQGTQCMFDTARGGAVWVPDSVCIDEIERRAVVYQKGKILKDTKWGKTYYKPLVWRSGGEFEMLTPEGHEGGFMEWGEAFKYLEAYDHKGCIQSMYHAGIDAAKELAKEACEQYTSWTNGDCYCVVQVTYDLTGTLVDHDLCGGYVGGDYAYETLKQEFDAK